MTTPAQSGTTPSQGIPDRRISKKVAERYSVTVEYGPDGTITRHYYPIHNTNGDLIGSKVREVEGKRFHVTGTTNDCQLFGQEICRGGGKFITITEGELDALSVSEMFGGTYDIVSLVRGASAAKKEVQAQLEFLESYETVVLCFDNDKAGEEAVDAVKDLFSPGKLKIVKLSKGMKDASDYLSAGQGKSFVSAWWDAKTYRPDGIVSGSDTWDRIVERRDIKSIPYPWAGLNELTRGMRYSELVTLTSGSGMGKSQVVRELEHYLLRATEDNIGVIALEEDISRSALGIMSVEANRPLHLEEDTDTSELRPYWEATLGTGRYFLFDHWGSTGADNLLARVRYMGRSLNCKVIFLDHLSIVVSAQENGDERKAIDEIMTKLRSLVQELGILLILVSHLRRTSGQTHEEGGKVSLGDLRGSQSIAQLSDMVIGLERNQQDEDLEARNTSLVRVLKNRYTGETGPAAWLRYDKFTARLTEVAPPTAEGEF